MSRNLAITLLFALLFVSTLVGASLLQVSPLPFRFRKPTAIVDEPEPAQVEKWITVQVALTFGLLSLAVTHGVFVHTHGLLAHYVLAK